MTLGLKNVNFFFNFDSRIYEKIEEWVMIIKVVSLETRLSVHICIAF